MDRLDSPLKLATRIKLQLGRFTSEHNTASIQQAEIAGTVDSVFASATGFVRRLHWSINSDNDMPYGDDELLATFQLQSCG